jgi:hypothetical protein
MSAYVNAQTAAPKLSNDNGRAPGAERLFQEIKSFTAATMAVMNSSAE